MIGCNIHSSQIYARQTMSQHEERLPRLHIRIELQAGAPRGFKFPRRELIFIPVHLALPA